MCLCEYMSIGARAHNCVHQWRSQEGIRCPFLSLLACLRQNVSLNLGLSGRCAQLSQQAPTILLSLPPTEMELQVCARHLACAWVIGYKPKSSWLYRKHAEPLRHLSSPSTSHFCGKGSCYALAGWLWLVSLLRLVWGCPRGNGLS